MSVIKLLIDGNEKDKIKSVQIGKVRWGDGGTSFGKERQVPSGIQTVIVGFSHDRVDDKSKKEIGTEKYVATVKLDNSDLTDSWATM
jgi:hypothetical protein